MSANGSLNLSRGFAEASGQVLDHLKREVPLDTWAVTRHDGDDQVCLFARSDSLELAPGLIRPWSGSLCQRGLAGEVPIVVPDVRALEEGAGTSAADAAHGAHVGAPITGPDGTPWGTVCGLDPRPRPGLEHHEALLRLVTSLLSTILHEDLRLSDVARRLERAEMLAETDELTGLHNRRGWQHYIDHEEERFRRYGDAAAVIIVDLDQLKFTNDRYGHLAGDRLLARAAEIIRGSARSSDLTARLGGDEFGLIATHNSAVEVAALAGRLRQALACEGISASVGHAGYVRSGGLAGAWVAADAAMYAEKRRRRTAS